ncbi:threonine synthase [Chengkuizengella axinellae]|uniref:Threonine synthase n=1 Tax=Chengkuizengella axinellae TaxID=3064388 RepID=A0ABT9J3R9_9BACL|nr:threonine synthase [Chengkuizengella sp. 2205SS18-9]MDP5276244.1 threonine synthase [Chengkuizengella sp. 2205SS18-9]
MKIRCIDCEKQFFFDRSQYRCSCGGLFDIMQDFKNVDVDALKNLFHQRLSERMTCYTSGVWRYKELIYPELPDHFIVSKNEGNTGLYTSELVNQYTGLRKVWLKAQSENPSGSFKDNGMTVAVSHGRSLGYKKYACSSTGNTSSSLAMYAAMSNVESYVFVPNQHISMNKVLQTLAYGAKVYSFEGTYDDGIQFLEKNSEHLGLYVCNSINPFRIEGQKSIVYEAAQYLNWELPEWIIVPGGALSNASALGKGLYDLFTLGFINKLPRIAIIQAEGASPFHKMFIGHENEIEPESSPYTLASALNIGNPPSWKKALQSLIDTNGVSISVTDEEILDAKAIVDKSGVGCEPASAATIAGIHKLISERVLHKDETALCILTGNILKDTEILNDYHLTDQVHAAFQNKVQPYDLTTESYKSLF